MIKIHASYGLKVPGPEEFSSESFHATAEIELADNLVSHPDALRAALHSLWGDLKQAVAEEIRNKAKPGNNGQERVNRLQAPVGNGQPSRHVPSNGNGRRYDQQGRNGGGDVSASKKQIGFLLSLARRKRNLSAEQTRQWLQAERGLSLNALTKQQAGSLIDEFNVAN